MNSLRIPPTPRRALENGSPPLQSLVLEFATSVLARLLPHRTIRIRS